MQHNAVVKAPGQLVKIPHYSAMKGIQRFGEYIYADPPYILAHPSAYICYSIRN